MAFETETSVFPLQYTPRPGAYDEVRTPSGEPREHWKYVLRSLGALGALELRSRMREGTRLLREDGATYSVYGDPQGWNRPWALDPIPLVISSDEWARIESGLIQRAELLNLVLADLYGPRELIRLGLLPVELVYSHRGFIRACDGIRLPGRHQLVFYGADLARTPDGTICVLDDRAQAPSGAGYALENRTVMARILPSLYRDAHVHRLALFFRELRNTLHRLAPTGGDAPRVVVLTPGPHNEAYFEHAYLANYMGYTLVQGSDLHVRDGRVWLRSVRGFEPVDVIVRRTDDFFCDPLELRQDSQLGVPGLVEAARRGNVSIINPLGSGVLENPGLLPFLPAIAKHFLGQDLRIRSVPSWWCGRTKDRNHVLANLERLVIRKIYSRRDSAVVGSKLSDEDRIALADRIRSQPYRYVGQESVELSSVPVLADGKLVPRPVVCRTFLVAREDSFVALPGGLTRFGPEGNSHVVSNQLGGASKDTWVIASEPESQISLWTTPQGRPIPRDPDGLLSSRATESLFWFGRYAERAGETLGLLRVIVAQLSEASLESKAGKECLEVLLGSLTHLTGTYPGFVFDGAPLRLRRPTPELLSLATDVDRTGSLAFNLRGLLCSAHAVRDLLSADTWRTLNDMETQLTSLQREMPTTVEVAERVLNEILKGLQVLAGVTMESMLRGPGWSFLDMGRRLERALSLCSVLRSTLVMPRGGLVEGLLMESVLGAAGTLASYRRLYRSHVQFETMLDGCSSRTAL